MTALREQTTIIPAVNQVEVHPYFTQPGVRQAGSDLGILTHAWSPIGGITSYYRGDAATSTFNDPVIRAGKSSSDTQASPNRYVVVPTPIRSRWRPRGFRQHALNKRC